MLICWFFLPLQMKHLSKSHVWVLITGKEKHFLYVVAFTSGPATMLSIYRASLLPSRILVPPALAGMQAGPTRLLARAWSQPFLREALGPPGRNGLQGP